MKSQSADPAAAPARRSRAHAPRRRHRVAASAAVLLGLAGTGFAYSAVLPSSQAVAAPPTSAELEHGRKLYLQNCSTCHGLSAEGTKDAGGAPTLVGVGAAAVEFQVGTGRMPMARPEAQAPRKPPVIKGKDLDALATYVATLGPGPARPAPSEYDASKANIAEGAELFRENCAACHNFAGQGGALTQGKFAPPVIDVEAKYVYEALQTGPQAMPVFNDKVMPPEKKRDIIAFLQHARTEPNTGGLPLGKLGPLAEGLFVWTFGLGSLVAACIWVAARTVKAPKGHK